jgi:hypothetical protein
VERGPRRATSLRRRWSAGREARAGGSSRDRRSGWASIDTLGTGGRDHTQGLVAKVESGADAKASTRCPELSPEEQNPRRGSGVVEANCLAGGRGSQPGSRPWSRGHRSRSRGATRGRRGWATSGGHGPSTRRPGWVAGTNPWKANPGRGCGMKQAHEAAEGESRRGRAKRRGRTEGRGWFLARVWISGADAAMGNRTSREALHVSIRGAGSQRNEL